jgi:hypothetical protein
MGTLDLEVQYAANFLKIHKFCTSKLYGNFGLEVQYATDFRVYILIYIYILYIYIYIIYVPLRLSEPAHVTKFNKKCTSSSVSVDPSRDKTSLIFCGSIAPELSMSNT